MKSWAEIGFEIEVTGDGSPSLRLLQSVDPSKYRGESMHHSGGAWAETRLIYGEPVAEIIRHQAHPEFLVVGLGLGYIEMAIAREALLAQAPVGRITSFESVPELRTYFWRWLHGQSLPCEQEKVYQTAVAAVIQGTELQAHDIQKFLQGQFPSEESFGHELGSEFALPSRYHGIMYDAFSSKTTPHLWEEEFLTRFLQQAAAVPAILTTYACRGSLKRALQNSGFEVVVRPGFQGKRNSTLGRKLVGSGKN